VVYPLKKVDIIQDKTTRQANRLRTVLNSDRATLTPIELFQLQQRIATALQDLMDLDADGIEYVISRKDGIRVLELRMPIRAFHGEVSEDNLL